MKTLSDRIKERMEELGLSQEALGERVGVSQVAVGKVVNGKTENPRNLYEYAKALRTTTEWLKEGKEPKEHRHYVMNAEALADPLSRLPLHLQPGPAAGVVAWEDPSELEDETIFMPHYDVSLSAGDGQSVCWAKRSSNKPLPFRLDFFRARGLNPDRCRCLYVRGDSMEPELFDRDTVMIDIKDTAIVDGGVYAVLYADEIYIKLLYRIPGGGIEMRSRNPIYEPVRILGPDLSRFTVLGRKVYRSG